VFSFRKHKDSQGWDDRRPHTDFGCKSSTYKQKSWNNNTNENKKESSKALTYREWKDQQQKRNEGKSSTRHEHYSSKPSKEKRYHEYDEKPPSSLDKYTHEPHRRPKYGRDMENDNHQSPRNFTSTVQSPTHFHQISRKRTYSNNSDSLSSSDMKRIHRDYEQVSPEPGEIT